MLAYWKSHYPFLKVFLLNLSWNASLFSCFDLFFDICHDPKTEYSPPILLLLLLSAIMWSILKWSLHLNLQCNNKRSGRYACWKVSCWGWNGHRTIHCYSLCNRGMRTEFFPPFALLVVIGCSHYHYLIVHHLHKQVSPAFVRGTYGSFTQIATCIGLIGALLIGIPAKEIDGW